MKRMTLFERMSGLARRASRPAEQLGELDQLRRPDATRRPVELPARDRLDRE